MEETLKKILMIIVCMAVSQTVLAYNCTNTNYANSFNNNEFRIKDNFTSVLTDIADLWAIETSESYLDLNTLKVEMHSISNGFVLFLVGELSFTTRSNKTVNVNYLSIPEMVFPIMVEEKEYCGLGPFDVVKSMFDVKVDGEARVRTYFVDTPHSELSIPFN
jgi:hypothetical protein